MVSLVSPPFFQHFADGFTMFHHHPSILPWKKRRHAIPGENLTSKSSEMPWYAGDPFRCPYDVPPFLLGEKHRMRRMSKSDQSDYCTVTALNQSDV